MSKNSGYQQDAGEFFDDFLENYRPVTDSAVISEHYSPEQLQQAKSNLENLLGIGEESAPERVKYLDFYIGEKANHSDVFTIGGIKANLLGMFRDFMQMRHAEGKISEELFKSLSHLVSDINPKPHNKWHDTKEPIPYTAPQNEPSSFPMGLKNIFTPAALGQGLKKIILPLVLSIPLVLLSSSSLNQNEPFDALPNTGAEQTVQVEDPINSPTPPKSFMDPNDARQAIAQTEALEAAKAFNTPAESFMNPDDARQTIARQEALEAAKTFNTPAASFMDPDDAKQAIAQQQTIQRTIETRGPAGAEQFGERDAYYRSLPVNISATFNIGPLLDKDPANDIATLEQALNAAGDVYNFNSSTTEIIELQENIEFAKRTTAETGNSVFIMTADSMHATNSYFNMLTSAANNNASISTEDYANALTRFFSDIAKAAFTENKPKVIDDTKPIAPGIETSVVNAQQQLVRLGYGSN